MTIRRTYSTKNIRLALTRGDAAKKAGSNHLSITVPSEDWRVGNQSISMTIRDAQALRNFLNQHLD
jgi:hypothetical protein